MISTANEPLASTTNLACEWDMTVLELAIFLAVYRAKRPPQFDDVLETLSTWFEGAVPRKTLSRGVLKMGARGWLVADGDRLLPAEPGRRAACPLVNGIIRLLDQGTRLIDVALMLAVLRLTREELQHGDPHN
jgi:hypothetical protein